VGAAERAGRRGHLDQPGVRMTSTHTGIAGVAYAFPETRRSVRELAAAGQLVSTPELLEEFGFGHVHVATCETPYDLARRAADALLNDSQVPRESVDLLLYAGTPSLAFAPAGSAADAPAALGTTQRFHFPATRLQFDLGLENANAIGLNQLACSTLFGAVRFAKALCESEGLTRVLCVSSEFFPGDAGREAIFNCTSDAACAVIVERGVDRNRIIASGQVTKGYYWDCDALRNEIVASYFPTSRHVVAETLQRAGWRPDDVTWVIPHNVSLRSWEILMGLIGIPRDRLWSENIARNGHTLAGDNFINFRDAVDAGAIRQGDRLLFFSYGYGAHWNALAVEA
jgi:3-oxoacyl-[acyl-carrier-protein] synthase-3